MRLLIEHCQACFDEKTFVYFSFCCKEIGFADVLNYVGNQGFLKSFAKHQKPPMLVSNEIGLMVVLFFYGRSIFLSIKKYFI
jgi:hypothetical protein